MNRVPAVLAASALLISLAGCSSTPTKEDACAETMVAFEQITRSLKSAGTAKTAADAEVHLEPLLKAGEQLRGVEGPAELMEINGKLADRLAAFVRKGVEVAAGKAQYGTEQAEYLVAMDEFGAYCGIE